jgi:hypothetical protein
MILINTRHLLCHQGFSKYIKNEVAMSMKICLVRPPALPSYQDTDIKEDPMLTSLIAYFQSINFSFDHITIFDFQLDRTINYQTLLSNKFDHYVVVARDLGESYRYSLRVAKCLEEDTSSMIWLYGQVAPLRYIKNYPKRISIVNQSESELAKCLGLDTNGAHFSRDLISISYFDQIQLLDWQKNRKKGAIETTRGCPYQCKFCFISAGDSYEKRWLTRPNDNIMLDLKSYIDQNVRTFVFLDSEFLGMNQKYHQQKKQLLERIIKELPPIKYMILCRADTLQKFDQFDLLQKSGLNKVLVGVESLYQPDLDALRKDSKVEIMMESITQLIEHEVECCLTFLTFHRNTTIEGLRENIKNIKKLYSHPKARYLGMPNFSFNMEVVRGEIPSEQMRDISDLTYIQPLLEARTQLNSNQACFPVEMEPLIEIYRLLQYEWVVKKCELIKEKASIDAEGKQAIENWFKDIGSFCLQEMLFYLDLFEAKKLTLNNLLHFKNELFEKYQCFYQKLPGYLRKLSTYDSHAKQIDYQQALLIEDHGWDNIIPQPKQILI